MGSGIWTLDFGFVVGPSFLLREEVRPRTDVTTTMMMMMSALLRQRSLALGWRARIMPPIVLQTASFHQGWKQWNDAAAAAAPSSASSLLLPLRRQQHRTIVHIPIIGGIASAKLLALLAVKKTVVLAVLHKYGLKGTFELLKTTNRELHLKLGENQYPKAAFEAVNIAIDLMESSMSKLEPKEQAEYIVRWFRSIESTPDLRIFPTEFIKNSYQSLASYVSTVSPIFSSRSTTPKGTRADESTVDPGKAYDAKKFKLENEEEEDSLLKMIDDRIPEVQKRGYEVVLIKKKE